MTPAEFKAVRKRLGFSVQLMADALTDPVHSDVRPAINARTIRRWEQAGSGEEIPHPVVVAVRLLEHCGRPTHIDELVDRRRFGAPHSSDGRSEGAHWAHYAGKLEAMLDAIIHPYEHLSDEELSARLGAPQADRVLRARDIIAQGTEAARHSGPLRTVKAGTEIPS